MTSNQPFFNKSILLGKVLLFFKSWYITPLIKKSTFNTNDVCFCRPISNLCLLKASGTSRARHGHGPSKSMSNRLNRYNLLLEHQSAQNHSTETAVVWVSSYLLTAASDGQMSLLVLLDFWSFWHCRSWHSRTTIIVVRLQGLCPCLVSVVPSRSFLLCRLWWTSLVLYLYNMRSAPRLRSGPTSFILSKIDYGNSTLVGLPA